MTPRIEGDRLGLAHDHSPSEVGAWGARRGAGYARVALQHAWSHAVSSGARISPVLDATGAAAAYALSISGMYAVYATMACRELRRLRADAETLTRVPRYHRRSSQQPDADSVGRAKAERERSQ